jgi:ribose transport system substrate-binding protein
MLRSISAAVLVLATALLAGCGGAHSGDEHFYLISANIKVPYWSAAGQGFVHAAEMMKVRADFTGPDTYDPQAQKAEFERVMKANPTGILVSPADPNLMKADIDAAISQGIPVITIDSDAPDSKRLFFIGTNNYRAGTMGGDAAAKALKGRGNVIVFTMPGQANLEDRLRGYRDAFSKYPGIKITRIVDIKGDPRIAFDTTEEAVGSKKEKIDGFICLEALAGKEVANVLDRVNANDRVVIAMDTDPDTLDWIRRGKIQATIAQKPYTMSYMGVQLLDLIHHNKPASLDMNWAQDTRSPIPAFVDTGESLIDRSNVDAFLQGQQAGNKK